MKEGKRQERQSGVTAYEESEFRRGERQWRSTQTDERINLNVQKA